VGYSCKSLKIRKHYDAISILLQDWPLVGLIENIIYNNQFNILITGFLEVLFNCRRKNIAVVVVSTRCAVMEIVVPEIDAENNIATWIERRINKTEA
jgi:hypothetical protein